MLQLILFSPDSIVPSGAKLLSSTSILPVFYVYSYPQRNTTSSDKSDKGQTVPLISLPSPLHLPCISLATKGKNQRLCLTIFKKSVRYSR